MKRIMSLYSKATATRKGSNAAIGSDAAEGSEKRPRDRPRGRGKDGGKMRPPSTVPSSPFELPSAHSSSEEEEVLVKEEAGVEEEEARVEEEVGMGGGDRGYLFLKFVACVVVRSLDPPEAIDTS